MTAESLPNKCDFCGLRVHIRFRDAAASLAHDEESAKIYRLNAAGVIRQRFPRNVMMSIGGSVPDFGSTAYCAIDSDRWQKPVNCHYWVRRFDGSTVADYMAIHQDRRMLSMQLAANIIASVALLIALVAVLH